MVTALEKNDIRLDISRAGAEAQNGTCVSNEGVTRVLVYNNSCPVKGGAPFIYLLNSKQQACICVLIGERRAVA